MRQQPKSDRLLGALLPLGFGRRYVISDLAVLLVALLAFVRIARSEPHTSLLFHTHNTAKLAVANQAPAIGLLVIAVFAIVHPTLESILVGGLGGEIAGLCIVAFMTCRLLRSAIYGYAFSMLGMSTVVVVAGFLAASIQNHEALAIRVAIAGGFLIFIVVCAGLPCSGPYRKAYRTGQ